jgi:hypothetical protein
MQVGLPQLRELLAPGGLAALGKDPGDPRSSEWALNAVENEVRTPRCGTLRTHIFGHTSLP